MHHTYSHVALICACGCGRALPEIRVPRSGRRWLTGHCNRGRKQSPELVARRVAAMLARPKEATEAFAKRFWAKVDRTGECWLWMRGLNRPGGYGRMQWQRRNTPAHRIAFTLTFGEIPSGLCVLHRCDTPRCCNPAHLWLGTISDNMKDAVEKGRLSPVIPWATRWGWMIVRCAWCSRVTGAKPGEAGTVSDGICPPCEAKHFGTEAA